MILAILQARMSSSRLPGKVMRPILGRPMLARQIDRVNRSRLIDKLVIATSVEPDDDVVAAWAAAAGVACHRGDLADVLQRFIGALDAFGPADHVVRLTGDCPLADWEVIDAAIVLHLESGADYSGNVLERTYPDGLDVEVMTAAALRQAGREARDPAHREHVTMFINRQPALFRQAYLTQEPSRRGYRWTVDTPSDFAFAEAVFAALLAANPAFKQQDVLDLVAAHPEIAALNS